MNEQIFISEILNAGIITDAQAKSIKRFMLRKKPELNSGVSCSKKKQVVKETILNYFNQTWDNVVSKKRLEQFVKPRHVYFYVCTEYLGQGLLVTGREVGNRDHTSVIHARDKIRDMIDISDEETISVLNRVKTELQNLTQST